MNRRRYTRLARGFTLIELLVVLLILGMIAGIVGPKIMDQFNKSKAQAAKLQIEEFGNTLDLFKLDVGRYPDSQEGLQALIQAPTGQGADRWHGPYLRKPNVPKDPWSNDYQYTAPGKHGPYDIVSFGADGREGGEGENKDVASWE